MSWDTKKNPKEKTRNKKKKKANVINKHDARERKQLKSERTNIIFFFSKVKTGNRKSRKKKQNLTAQVVRATSSIFTLLFFCLVIYLMMMKASSWDFCTLPLSVRRISGRASAIIHAQVSIHSYINDNYILRCFIESRVAIVRCLMRAAIVVLCLLQHTDDNVSSCK